MFRVASATFYESLFFSSSSFRSLLLRSFVNCSGFSCWKGFSNIRHFAGNSMSSDSFDNTGHRVKHSGDDADRLHHGTHQHAREPIRTEKNSDERKTSYRRRQSVPEVKNFHHRYFENPFPEYNGQPPHDFSAMYVEEALTLMRKTYHYYSSVNLARCEPDLYTGLSGVAFACHRIAENELVSEPDKQMALGLGRRLLEAAVGYRGPKDDGFLVGSAGIFVAGALMYRTAGSDDKAMKCLETFAQFCSEINQIKVKDSSGDEMFSGRVGYLDGFLELWKVFPNNQILQQINVQSIIEATLASGKKYSKKCKLEKQCPLYFYHFGSDYLGAAHGISSILQLLLSFPSVIKNIPNAEADLKQSIDYVISQQDASGNFPPVFGEERQHDGELIHWCHGAPGVIYMIAKAYLVWREQKYLDVADACTTLIWKKGLLRKGPGICHGIAGNGYAFLLMYRLTQQAEYLYRAQCFADIMFQDKVQEKSRTPDNPYSLFEGISGTACFLADLATPTNAAFPFCDVFTNYC